MSIEEVDQSGQRKNPKRGKKNENDSGRKSGAR
jgi:hypothetical protein